MEILIKPVVSVMVLRTGDDGQPHILLQRRTKPGQIECWELPQGKIRQGENLHQAAHRELAEETGLQLTRVLTPGIAAEAPQIGGHRLQSFQPASCVLDVTGEYLAVCVLAQATGEAMDTNEACGHRWMSRTDIQQVLDTEEVFPLNIPMLHAAFAVHLQPNT